MFYKKRCMRCVICICIKYTLFNTWMLTKFIVLIALTHNRTVVENLFLINVKVKFLMGTVFIFPLANWGWVQFLAMVFLRILSVLLFVDTFRFIILMKLILFIRVWFLYLCLLLSFSCDVFLCLRCLASWTQRLFLYVVLVA